MKTSELTGALLDQWVARALGLRMEMRKHSLVPMPIMLLVEGNGSFIRGVPQYSADWAIAGPIIQGERIDLTGPDDGATDWWAHCWDDRLQENWTGKGETPLMAAMRAYVASKFGNEVPDSHEAALDSAK